MESSGTRGLRQPGETLPGGSIVGTAKGQRELRLGVGEPQNTAQSLQGFVKHTQSSAAAVWLLGRLIPKGIHDPNHAPEPGVRNTEVVIPLYCDPYFSIAPKSQSVPYHWLWRPFQRAGSWQKPSSPGSARGTGPGHHHSQWNPSGGKRLHREVLLSEKTTFPGRKRKNTSLEQWPNG